MLVLEKCSHLGGTTGIAVGSLTAAGTRFQHAKGITDNPAEHDQDAGKFAAPEIESRNNESLRKWFLAEAAETIDWLEGLGLSFYGPSPEPPNRVPRMHNVVPSSRAYIEALAATSRAAGSNILCQASVVELLKESDRITGVRAEVQGQTRDFQASLGVVLAGGDYANSPELIGRHKGTGYAAIEGINTHSTGEGHHLAESVGAKLLNMDITYGPELRFVPPTEKSWTESVPRNQPVRRMLAMAANRLPGWIMRPLIKRLVVTWQHPEDAMFADGAILINARGERFCNEKSWPDRELAVAQQPDKVSYLLLDGRLIERYSAWPHFISTAPDIAYAYVADYLRLRKDVAVKSDGLEGLARARAMDPEVLQETTESFNRYLRGECDDEFGRRGDSHALERGPWVLLGPAKAYFTTTEGGAAITEQFQVLDHAGQPIKGLYAVGQNGLGGMILWGHGLHIAWAMTSGRMVGQVLADLVE